MTEGFRSTVYPGADPGARANGDEPGQQSKAKSGRRASRVAQYVSRRIPGTAVTKHVADDFLVHGWFDIGESVMIYGPSGTAKTFLAIDVCLHLAALAPWHGAPVTQTAGRIVYLIAEGRKELFLNRVEAWCEEHPELAAAARANFEVIPVRSDFHGSDDAECLADALAQIGGQVLVIVIDTLAANMGEGDESTSRDISLVYSNVAVLQGLTGAAVALIHHAGKDVSRGARGSSNIRAGLDVLIAVASAGGVITASSEKLRERVGDLEFSFRLKSHYLGTTPRGFDITAGVVVPLTSQEKTEARDKAKASGLTGQNLKAYEALVEASAASTRQYTNTPDYPSNRKLVNAREWRDIFATKVFSGEEPKPDTVRAAWRRAKNQLIEVNLVCTANDIFWLVPDTRHAT